MTRTTLTDADYAALAEFRYRLRCFLEFSERAARDAGLTPRQHQALLAIRGFGLGQPLTVGDLAERLRVRHHSAVELVDRLCESGFLTRAADPQDQRRVLLALTPAADARLALLSAAHLDELGRVGPLFSRIAGLGRPTEDG